MRRAARSIGGIVALVLLFPAVAAAHPEVERLRRAVMEGAYEEARPGLDAALERDDLRLPDLVAVLELRAVLFHGMTDEAALDATLRTLGAIDPTHRFGPRFPPDLAQRSEALRAQGRAPLSVVTRNVPSAVGVRLEAAVENDTERVVRRLRYRVFDAASGRWASVEPPIEAAAGREVLVLIEAVGPGGAVVATAGSSDQPVRVAGPDLASGEGSDANAPSVSSGDDDWVPWTIVAIVAAVLAGLGVGIYFSENPRINWQPSAPMETR